VDDKSIISELLLKFDSVMTR